MQGQLRARSLSSVIQTECEHCRRSIRIEIDSELRFHVVTGWVNPLIYVPLVNLRKLDEPSIIDRF